LLPAAGSINFQAGFTYTNERDVTEPVPPLRGFGGGSFTLSGGLLVVNGTLSGDSSWQWQGGSMMVDHAHRAQHHGRLRAEPGRRK